MKSLGKSRVTDQNGVSRSIGSAGQEVLQSCSSGESSGLAETECAIVIGERLASAEESVVDFTAELEEVVTTSIGKAVDSRPNAKMICLGPSVGALAA